MVAIWVEGDTVISIPSIEDYFLGAMGDELCLVKWGMSVLSLPGCMEVQCLEVNCFMGLAVLLGQTTMHWHHMTGLPIGTSSMIPRWTS